MKNNNKGNLILTFILLVGISAILLSYIYLITGRVVGTASTSEKSKALYIAEAGINKATWQLMTPTGSGGQGNNWRVSASSESFGDGRYTFSIFDAPQSRVTIISTGEYSGTYKTLQQSMSAGTGTTGVFNYAVYSSGNFSMTASGSITGSVFANGNVTKSGSGSISGTVYLTAGHTYSSGTPTIIAQPPIPTVDPTYYNNLLATAASHAAGNVILNSSSDYNLNGGDLFVNGNFSNTMSGKIKGGGRIIVTGTFSNNASGSIDQNTQMISSGAMTIGGSGAIGSGAVIYSPSNITISRSGDLTGSIISQAAVNSTGSGRIVGLVYSASGISGSGAILGAVVIKNAGTYSGSGSISYSASNIPSSIPGISSGLSLLKGTWKEL